MEYESYELEAIEALRIYDQRLAEIAKPTFMLNLENCRDTESYVCVMDALYYKGTILGDSVLIVSMEFFAGAVDIENLKIQEIVATPSQLQQILNKIKEVQNNNTESKQ